jgi:hypothetical protein
MEATTLENSYCIPGTVDECEALGVHGGCVGYAVMWDPIIDGIAAYGADEVGDDSRKVSVEQHLDMTRNRIAVWRLEDLGWEVDHDDDGIHSVYKQLDGCAIVYFPTIGKVTLNVQDGNVVIPVSFEGIDTFTDLMTLERLKAPKSDE